MSAPAEDPRARLSRWLACRTDDDVLRAVFGVMLMATAGVLALDYWTLANGTPHAITVPAGNPQASPAEPPASQPAGPRRSDRVTPLRRSDARLQGKMTFDLQSDGRLAAVGTILPGTAKVFAEEIAKRGSYVKTVVLHSPGGSLTDAIAMGRLIRERKFATEVEGGAYCASACPLVFAGGAARRAGAKAAIGVHRAVAVSSGPLPDRDGMEDGQRVSATAQKYLRDMGVDLGVWVHAMETPHDRLYTFSADELIELKLATETAGRLPASAKARS